MTGDKNPNLTLGGNPTRPLETSRSVVVAVRVEGKEWHETRLFRSWTRAVKSLQPVSDEALPDSDWHVWTGCVDGTTWWVALDEVS